MAYDSWNHAYDFAVWAVNGVVVRSVARSALLFSITTTMTWSNCGTAGPAWDAGAAWVCAAATASHVAASTARPGRRQAGAGRARGTRSKDGVTREACAKRRPLSSGKLGSLPCFGCVIP